MATYTHIKSIDTTFELGNEYYIKLFITWITYVEYSLTKILCIFALQHRLVIILNRFLQNFLSFWIFKSTSILYTLLLCQFLIQCI